MLSGHKDRDKRGPKLQRMYVLVSVPLICITMIFIPLFPPTISAAYAAPHQQKAGTVYTLNASPSVLSPQNCTSPDGTTYSCSLLLLVTPLPVGTTTITVSDATTVNVAVTIQNPVLSATQPSTAVSITSLPCPSAPIVVTFAGISSQPSDQVVPTSTTWSCVAQPTATPSPTATPLPTPSPTPVPRLSPTPGSSPTAVPSKTATAVPSPVVGASPSPVPSTTSLATTPSATSPKSTSTTAPGVTATVNGQTPTPIAGGSGTGNNTPPPSSGGRGGTGELFTMAGIVLALVALLLYLFSAGQTSMSERILSLVLPQALLRRIRGHS